MTIPLIEAEKVFKTFDFNSKLAWLVTCDSFIKQKGRYKQTNKQTVKKFAIRAY
jgi:hypothetical protein